MGDTEPRTSMNQMLATSSEEGLIVFLVTSICVIMLISIGWAITQLHKENVNDKTN
jgi:hypothetical protein